MLINALSLSGIHPDMDTPPVVPGRAAPHVTPVLAEAGQFMRSSGTQAAGAGATQSAYFAELDGVAYRVKLNPPDRLTNTFHEVLSARLLNDIGLHVNPPSAWVVDEGEIWVASRVIPNARDLGPYLLHAAGEQATRPGKPGREAGEALARYRELDGLKQSLSASDAIRPLLEKYRKGGFDQLTASEHAALQPLRDVARHMLQVQEQILDLLPQGRALRSSLLTAAYAGEVVGEWDFLNDLRFNTMVYQDEAGGIHVQTVDRGVSGPVGFGGELKEKCEERANQPAKISDPYASANAAESFYLPGMFSRRDMDFRKPSPSAGLIGSIPRSASSAFIFKDVIRNEREHLVLQPDTGSKARLAPQGMPEEALQVAWLLKHRADPQMVARSIAAACNECRRHPATRAMLRPEVMGAADARALAALYNARIQAIIARAEEGGALNRWANRNPAQARRILMDGALGGAV
ncbi:MAG: hypothetical protein GAK35_04210 [Herbaspirillum frisingense]|uniref:Uncharacterized protein n=1 Tax=Herbaspirillum frisingense TaxID=92645 RepID=A0A7V8JSJ2_9BURK|nr:MAG: hypothetical protein GAK35_04210 [Herbaspirillum frisingense]